eukprot:2876257-Alexandrium_andersonii.AAC.1
MIAIGQFCEPLCKLLQHRADCSEHWSPPIRWVVIMLCRLPLRSTCVRSEASWRRGEATPTQV